MTVILALRHRDGFVLASDSQATELATGQPVKLDSGPKLHTIHDSIGWGASGHEGTIQQIKQAVDSQESAIYKEFKNNGLQRGADRLFRVVHPVQETTAKSYIPQFDNTGGQASPATSMIFAGFCEKKPFLMEISNTGIWQFHDRPFVAIGSASALALYAIISVAHYEVQNLDEKRALALAYRTVKSAIDTAAFGIGGAIQLIAGTVNGAKRLDKTEIDVVEDTVNIWKQREIEVLGTLAPVSKTESEQIQPAKSEPPKE